MHSVMFTNANWRFLKQKQIQFKSIIASQWFMTIWSGPTLRPVVIELNHRQLQITYVITNSLNVRKGWTLSLWRRMRSDNVNCMYMKYTNLGYPILWSYNYFIWTRILIFLHKVDISLYSRWRLGRCRNHWTYYNIIHLRRISLKWQTTQIKNVV